MKRFAKIENESIVETEVSQVQMMNRRDNGTYLEQKLVVKPQETVDYKCVAMYTIDGEFVIKSWNQVPRTEAEKAVFTDKQEKAAALKKLAESREYLNSTDWYYARLAETGEVVPEEVVAKRLESRNFIRDNEHLEQKPFM